MPDDPAAPQRLFLALWPRDDVREALARYQALWHWPPGAARVPREHLHLTLHFLGQVPAATASALRARLREAPVPFEPFSLVLEPRVWTPGIAVLAAPTLPDPLARLHAHLGEVIEATGLTVESRRYRPHVTLARKAHGARAPGGPSALRWQVEGGCVLVRSRLGVGYEVLETCSA